MADFTVPEGSIIIECCLTLGGSRAMLTPYGTKQIPDDQTVQRVNTLTRDGLLPPVSAAEAGNSTRDDHHETDAHSADNQEELQVDLAVLASKPGVTVAGDLRAVEDTLTVPVTELALRAGSRADPAWEETGWGDVQVAGHAGTVVRSFRVRADGFVGAVIVLLA